MADFDAVVESDEELEGAAPEVAESSSDDLRSALQAATKEVTERMRDEQGRFAEKPEAKPVKAEAVQPVVQEAPAAQPVQPVQAVESAPRAPDAWSPAAKAQFNALPPEVQAEISRREAEVHKGFTKLDEPRQLGKQFSDVVNPYIPMIRAEGGNPVAAVQDLLQTTYTLRTANPQQKQELFLKLAGQFGVDMQGVFNRLQGQPPQQQVNPQVAQMQQQLWQLQQERQQQQLQAEQQTQAQINQTIEGFASDPKNVYFSNVRAEMAALLSNGNAKDLQEAYEMACWARPDIRPLLQQQIDLQKANDAKVKANRARLAGSSISGSPSGAVTAAEGGPNESLRDTLRRVMRDRESNL